MLSGAFTSSVSIQSGMLVTCRIQYAMSCVHGVVNLVTSCFLL